MNGRGGQIAACTCILQPETAGWLISVKEHRSSAIQCERVLLSLAAPPSSPHADPDRPWCQAYVVQSGDTDTSIASMFGMTVPQLIALNTDYLQGGQAQPYANEYLRLPGW